MKIKALEGQKLEELSMIEVTHAILEQNGEETSFDELLKETKDYLGKSDEDIAKNIAHFYTELNTDGSFIPTGDGKWGLRSWYAIDSINEETISLDYFDDDAIDDSVDPSLLESDDDDDSGFKAKVAEEIVYDENTDDEPDETVAYDEELAEVNVDADEIPEDEVVDLSDEDDGDDE